MRRILEQSHGKVQQIVIDLEGEFSTLREQYDYLLCGKGGDVPASPKTAGLLAKKILKLNASAIIDLYELPHHDRKRFVRLFLESMINAPKELWHSCFWSVRFAICEVYGEPFPRPSRNYHSMPPRLLARAAIF